MDFLRNNLIPILIGGVTVLVLSFIIFSPPKGGGYDQKIVASGDLISHDSLSFGEASASATLVEFSDFQCPACRLAYPIIRKVKGEFGDSIRFVYRHFPLPQHKNARKASEASEAAASQGRFLEYHNILFENQDEWSELSNDKALEQFVAYASDLGLDVEKFRKELEGNVYEQKVIGDLSAGQRLGVNSTPTIFLNGQRIVVRSYEQLKSAILNVL